MKLIWGDFTAPQNLRFSKFYAFSRGHNFGYKSDRIVKQSAFDVKWAEKKNIYSMHFLAMTFILKVIRHLTFGGRPPPLRLIHTKFFIDVKNFPLSFVHKRK